MSGHRDSAQVTEKSYPSLWKNRNFLQLFFGLFVSNIGDSLYNVAISWLVFELSGSVFLTGVAKTLLLLPFLLRIIAGPIVDQFSIKPILVGTQVVQGALVLVLPAAGYTGNLTVALILVTIPALSLMALLVAPARAALVPRIVAKSQLSRTNSALKTITVGLDMIFDALGGLFIAVFGAMSLFILDSVTFVIAGLLFFGMSIPVVSRNDERSEGMAVEQYVASLREGINILRGTVFIDMMFATAVFNSAVGVTLGILPAFGALLGGPAVYGLLLGALGVGRVVGTISAPYLHHVAYGKLKAVTYLISAFLWLGSAYSPSVVLTVGLFGLAWVSAGIDAVRVETLTQTVFPVGILGRVSSIREAVSIGTLPIGSLIGGFVAEQLGTRLTIGLAAFGFGFAGLYFVLRPSLRRLSAVDDIDPEEFNVQVESLSALESADRP